MDVREVDFADKREAQAFVNLINMYASDPMGGGERLPDAVTRKLIDDLASDEKAICLMAWCEHEPVGLLNAFLAYSTFKAQPLLNVHDLAVAPAWRGQGVARVMLREIERRARALGCCKLTLEVLSGNTRAMRTYESAGFCAYALAPAMGTARFMQKWLL
jgi:ribosomal protein S18 acetylase RimI-like enzyme